MNKDNDHALFDIDQLLYEFFDKNPPEASIEIDSASPTEPAAAKKPRLRSLDALRGFDMFWIVGGHTLVASIAKFTGWDSFNWFSGQLHHPGWQGFTLYDLIFPLFLFLAGVSMPYSLGSQVELGKSKLILLRKVAIRAALLILLGAIYNDLLEFKPLTETRICSVLGFIGIAYFIAASIYLFTNTRHQVIWAAGILFGYWATLEWIQVPGHGAGVHTQEGSIRTFLDRELIPWRMNFSDKLYDPEGILANLSATVTALLGAITGQFLRHSKLNKFAIGGALIASGIILFYLAKLWSTQLFISKEMWNPPFVFHCAGWSLMLLGVFYLIIDALGFWRWSFFFIVIGMNSITVYLGIRMINFHHTSQFLFSGLIRKFETPHLQPLLSAIAFILTWWIVLLIMYRKNIFLRV